MSGMFRQIGWILVGIGFFWLGADAYWSWKSDAWTIFPIGRYLDLIDPSIAGDMRGWAMDRSARTMRWVEKGLSWPAWGPPFILGWLLIILTRERRVTRR